jgi:hypothetical protein
MGENFGAAIAPALVLLMVGLSVGSCNYLANAGSARVIEAKAALKAAERCQPQQVRP